MTPLIRLLLKERRRKLEVQYGWAARLSFCFLLVIGAWIIVSVSSRLTTAASTEQLAAAFNNLLGVWVIAGILTGKDLTWHVRLDRLCFFPLSFRRLYGSALILSLLSFPVVLVLCVLEISIRSEASNFESRLALAVGFCLLACAVRPAVSIVRTGLHRGNAMRKAVRYLLWGVVASLAALAIGPLFRSDAARLLPGYQYALVVAGVHRLQSLLLLAVWAVALLCVDYMIQREVVYSGIAGPAPLSIFRRSRGRFLLFRPSPSATLLRVGILGWLRNRNALLLLIWGALYSFLYTYLTKASGQIYFIAFIWMVLIFHGYLRGNLLGVDNRAAWLYYVLPIPIENTIRAKNSALSLLQILMAGATLLPAVLRRTAGMTSPLQWIGTLSFACSGVMLGEIFGSVFSVLHPEPIERSSLCSGGTTPGAFLVPLLQTFVLGALAVPTALAGRIIGTISAALLFVSVPAMLWLVRSSVLRLWVHRRMTARQEEILFKLMGS